MSLPRIADIRFGKNVLIQHFWNKAAFQSQMLDFYNETLLIQKPNV